MNNNIKAFVSSLTAAAIICAMCVSLAACTKANAGNESVPIEEPSIESDALTKAKQKLEEDLGETLDKYAEWLRLQGMEQHAIKGKVAQKKEEELTQMAADRMKKYDSSFESFKSESIETTETLIEAVCELLTNGTDVSLDDKAVFEVYLDEEYSIISGSYIKKDNSSPYTDRDKLIEKIETIIDH